MAMRPTQLVQWLYSCTANKFADITRGEHGQEINWRGKQVVLLTADLNPKHQLPWQPHQVRTLELWFQFLSRFILLSLVLDDYNKLSQVNRIEFFFLPFSRVHQSAGTLEEFFESALYIRKNKIIKKVREAAIKKEKYNIHYKNKISSQYRKTTLC